MKFVVSFILVALFVVFTSAQDICAGRPIIQVCTGGRDDGNSNLPTCRLRAQRMWWYNARTRTCLAMSYRGCGGNNNRYCSLASCRRICRAR